MRFTPSFKDGDLFCSAHDNYLNTRLCQLCDERPSFRHLLVEDRLEGKDRERAGHSDRVLICRQCAEPYLAMVHLPDLLPRSE